MRKYLSTISLTKNARGVHSIDPSIGCASGTELNSKGCYDDCYAVRASRVYGYDFNKTVTRNFSSIAHLYKIRKEVKRVELPFIRMGTMGDPSEDWEHSINICELIQNDPQLYLFRDDCKEIVIITKHWNKLTNEQLNRIKQLKIIINTSTSVLDGGSLLKHRIKEYERLKPFCKSILRLVTAKFNCNNPKGLRLHKIQESILKKHNVLDTVLRVSKNNDLVSCGIINIVDRKFLGKKCNASVNNRKAYFGKCNRCLEMCGVNILG